jgi:hypothetical protein
MFGERVDWGIDSDGFEGLNSDSSVLQLPAELHSLSSKEPTPFSSHSQVPSSKPILSNIHPHTSPTSGAQSRISTAIHVLVMMISKTQTPGCQLLRLS